MNEPPRPSSAERLDTSSVLAVLHEGVVVLADPLFGKLADRDEYVRCLGELSEQIEFDSAIPALDLLELGALNAVLERFRFYQHQAEARLATAGAHPYFVGDWRRALLRYTRAIAIVERLIRRPTRARR